MSYVSLAELREAIDQLSPAEQAKPAFFLGGFTGQELIAVFSLGKLHASAEGFDAEGFKLGEFSAGTPVLHTVRTCRHCGCTEEDCSQCLKRTGGPCYWVSGDECSACVAKPAATQSLKPTSASPQSLGKFNEQDQRPPRNS